MAKQVKNRSGDSAVAVLDADPACCASVVGSPLDDAAAQDLASAFAALADPVRCKLLSLISSAGEACSCDLQSAVERSQPTVSHHTSVLAEAGLIRGERRGRWVWWSVVPERLAALAGALGAQE